MVDAGADVFQLGRRHVEIGGELPRGALHGVTKPDGADPAASGDGPAEHGHRIHVLQQQRVGAQFLHLAAHAEQDGNRAQRTHDSSQAERVADRLPKSEALGHLEVRDGRRSVAADLDHRDDVVGPVECGAAIRGRLNARCAAESIGDPARDGL